MFSQLLHCRITSIALLCVATACLADEPLPYCGLDVKIASVHAEVSEPPPPCMGVPFRVSVSFVVGLDNRTHNVEITIVDAPPGVDRSCLVEVAKGAVRGMRFTPVKAECRYHMNFSAGANGDSAA